MKEWHRFKLLKMLPKLPRRYLWLAVLIPVIGLPLLAGMILGQQDSQVSTALTAKTIAPPSPAASASPTALPSPATPATAAPKASSKASPKASASPKPKPSTAAKPAAPALTAQEKALNDKYKASFQASLASVDSLIEMRVAIAEGVPSAAIGGSSGATLLDQNGKPLQALSAGTSYPVQPNGQSITFGSLQLPQVVWVEPATGGVLYLGDRAYHGRFLLAADAGHLWVVNFVNMQNYLASVVGSEVSSSWPMEALKAQAVAARSYALTYYFKPVNSLFQIGATESYQVYKGIEREAQTTDQAVSATAGEFVSYRGGIVESLYAASDDIVAEAFQGRGMSQLGALSLAERGYTYQQILGNYYPSTGIGRIVQDYE
jgi:hypothetical protein